ncbi:hypothetical protein BAU15_02560 [Enterococcus sp. JM4C]|uniref:post-transcriptional regulator n=1 Tax=Candidatus Enterococcus huntleyi TaxID=1857217 RepID=UPI00137A9229|nr:post-transcriptional regulator [Enterococcus sp. JM4C]KAF1299544.1 hypothetical protein BAU15_02560 [Enterococcus sp. JM4C]
MDKLIERILLHRAFAKKVTEFHSSGYEAISLEELKSYCLAYRWPKKKLTTYKEKRADILLIQANQIFDYQQLKIQTTAQTFQDLDDFSDLF